jgi:[CysO sulfur-carrier protein]-S-L-cysteine hydrolase
MLKIPQAIYDDIISHAQEGSPLEVCGILAGTGGEVSALYRMTNTDQSNEHFLMDPKEQFAVARELRARELAMLAIYHSHPETPARPSEEDIRLAFTPGVSHLIVSLADPGRPAARSFKIRNGAVEAEDLVVTP